MGTGIQKRKSFLIIIFLVWVVGAFIFVWSGYGRSKAEITKSYQNVTVAEFDEALSRDPFVVDVHVPEQAHLTGTDLFIDYQEVGKRLSEFPPDKNTEILVYCRSGTMSAQTAQVLADAGYTNVKNLIGGIQAWREQHRGVELTPKQKSLGTVIYGDIAATDFNLVNNTDEVVTVTRVSTSCGCTQAEVGVKELRPGEATTVHVTFNPVVHKDDTDLGDVTRTIFIETDQINFTEVTAEITANVVKKS